MYQQPLQLGPTQTTSYGEVCDSSSKARAKLDHDLGGEKFIQQCVMLPHDIVASMFDFKNGDVFYTCGLVHLAMLFCM